MKYFGLNGCVRFWLYLYQRTFIPAGTEKRDWEERDWEMRERKGFLEWSRNARI